MVEVWVELVPHQLDLALELLFVCVQFFMSD